MTLFMFNFTKLSVKEQSQDDHRHTSPNHGLQDHDFHTLQRGVQGLQQVHRLYGVTRSAQSWNGKSKHFFSNVLFRVAYGCVFDLFVLLITWFKQRHRIGGTGRGKVYIDKQVAQNILFPTESFCLSCTSAYFLQMHIYFA